MCARIRLLMILSIIVITLTVSAEAAVHVWSHSFGDAGDQIATSVAMDNSGNVILTGHFDGAVNFGGEDLVCGGPSDCVFLAKLDSDGNHAWSLNLGDSLKYNTNRFVVDGNSNILMVNDFIGTVNFGGGVIVADGFRDGVIAKFDADGNHVWSRKFGGTSATVDVKAAGIDGAGNLIVAGLFTGTIDFGGATLTASWFTTNMFIVKFHATGAHLWSKKCTGGSITITSVAGDPMGNAVVSGYHNGTFDFGGGPLAGEVSSLFVAKYDGAGNHVWSHTYGYPGTYQYINDVAMDLMGNVFITGEFSDPLDLGGGDLTSSGSTDIFLAKFGADGSHLWSQSFGDDLPQRSYSVAVDGYGMVTLAGHFFGEIDFGRGPHAADPLDFCVAKFDGAGAPQWSRRFDLFNLGMQNDKAYSIAAAVSVAGDMAFIGSFKDAVDCGGGDLPYSGGWDVFVAKFVPAVTGIRTQNTGNLRLKAQPNPFNPQTTISYSTLDPGIVSLRLYDVTGRCVRTLVERWTASGEHMAAWDGKDDRGQAMASGVYFVRLRSSGRVETQRVVLLK